MKITLTPENDEDKKSVGEDGLVIEGAYQFTVCGWRVLPKIGMPDMFMRSVIIPGRRSLLVGAIEAAKHDVIAYAPPSD